MFNLKTDFQKESGIINFCSAPVVFHCNHYNRTLQQSIEDATYIDFEKILVKSSAEVVFENFSKCFLKFPDSSFKEKLSFAEQVFKSCGFGLLDFSKLSETGGKIIGKVSHYGLASKLNFGHRTHPAEYFDKGFIIGVISAIRGTLSGKYFDDIEIKQEKSISLGEEYCEYQIGIEYSTIQKNLPQFVQVPPPKFKTNVDEDKITDVLSKRKLEGDEEGLIPVFGVYLTRMYADYYNKISFRFEEEIKKVMGTYEIATEMLIEAGHICAFNTFGGIMKSDEWKTLVLPMIENREDWVHGIVAVINTLGWGIWRVEELVPHEKLVMRSYYDYESLGHLKWFGKSDHHISYLMTGASAGIMNLIYYGDITTNPVLDKKYYYHLFKDQDCFLGKQTKCLAMGDEYSEVVVTRR